MPLRRARRSLALLLAALVLSLAACTGGGDAPPSPPATTPIAATVTATPAAPPAPIEPPTTPTPSPTSTATPTPTATVMPSPTATPAPTSTATPTPTPSEPPTTFRYDTYDTTGAVAEPGSYAFLADPADTTSAITTYEGLRDGTATALRIHETDADGVSRAAFLDTVEVGDLFEWRRGRGLLGPLPDRVDAHCRHWCHEGLRDSMGHLRPDGLQRRGSGYFGQHHGVASSRCDSVARPDLAGAARPVLADPDPRLGRADGARREGG